MKKFGKKFLLASFLGATVLGSTVAIATSCSSSSDGGSILVYYEKEWKPAYDLAVTKYNQGNHKYNIELKEAKAFDAFEKLNTLSYTDANVADLIYLPFDKIPTYAAKGNLLPFDSAQALVNGSNGNAIIGSNVYGSDINGFADLGKIGNKYYGIPHNKEAILMFHKGSFGPSMTFEDMYKAANNDNWSTKMATCDFKNMWLSWGVLSGGMGTTNGQAVGDAIINYQNNSFNSQMTSIENPASGSAAEGLQKAVDFISTYYASTVSKSVGNDWIMNDTYGENVYDKFASATDGAVIDGIWALDTVAKKAPNASVSVVPKLSSTMNYNSVPGGWAYTINARNEQNPEKIDDMKSFVNILLSDPEVINATFDSASKIVIGDVSSKTLTEKYPTSTLKGQAIKATLDTKPISPSPITCAEANYNPIYDAFNKFGFGSKPALDAAKAGTSGDYLNQFRKILVSSFNTMLSKQTKK